MLVRVCGHVCVCVHACMHSCMYMCVCVFITEVLEFEHTSDKARRQQKGL